MFCGEKIFTSINLNKEIFENTAMQLNSVNTQHFELNSTSYGANKLRSLEFRINGVG